MQAEKTQTLITRSQSAFITLSAVVSAVAIFFVTWLAASYLSVADNKDFLVFWAFLSFVFAALLGVQQETTRAIGQTQLNLGLADNRKHRLLKAVLFAGLTVVVAILLLWPLLPESVVPASNWLGIPFICLVAFSYAIHVYFIGANAAYGSWITYGFFLCSGALLCFLLSLFTVLFGGSLTHFKLAFAVTAFLWIVFLLLSRSTRLALMQKVVDSFAVSYRKIMLAVLAAGAVAALSTGFPVMLETVYKPADANAARVLAAIILAVSLTRAPIMIPLQAFQSVALNFFVRQKGNALLALLKPIACILAFGMLGAGIAFILGKTIFDFLYPNYAGVLQPWFFAALVFAAALLAAVTLTGSACLAKDKHGFYLGGWLVTAAVVFVCVLVPINIQAATVLALTLSPVCGGCVHLWGLSVRK